MTDLEKRDFILSGDMLKVVLSISAPIALYNAFNYAYGFLDAMIVSTIGAAQVSSVVYLDQITTAISSIGAGLAAGGSIIIARHYGANDLKSARVSASTLIFISVLTAIITICGIAGFESGVVEAMRTPQELIEAGRGYFRFQVINLLFLSVNSVYIGIEKAKGNTRGILKLNLMVMFIKLSLTCFFVYLLKSGVAMVALATLVAQGSLTIVAVRSFLSDSNIFKFSMGEVSISKRVLLPILTISIPIFLGKFVFSFGKVIVNSMCVVYGGLVIGALGLSNKLTGSITNICVSFEEGLSTIVSQNLGNKSVSRAVSAFKKTLMVNLSIAVLGSVLMALSTDMIVARFAQGDPEFAHYIKVIFFYEKFAIIALSVNSSVLGILYGLGYTKVAMTLNIIRLFVFRIPSLYIFQRFTDIGFESIGWAMLISNFLIGITSIVVYLSVRKRIVREECYILT